MIETNEWLRKEWLIPHSWEEGELEGEGKEG